MRADRPGRDAGPFKSNLVPPISCSGIELDKRTIATSGLLLSVWLAGVGHAQAQVTVDPPSRVDDLPVMFTDPVGAHPVFAAAASSAAVGPVVSRWRDRRLEFGLLASFAVVQALDAVSTLQAVRSPGIREANPVMAKLVGRPAAFLAAKAAASVTVGLIVRRLHVRHPRVAVVFMSAANAAMAVVVASNYRHIRRR